MLLEVNFFTAQRESGTLHANMDVKFQSEDSR